MAFNPMDFFQAGGQLGQANASPFTYGASNIMDRFNAGNDAAMKMAVAAQLFKGEKNYEWNNSPQSQEAQAKLNASGLGHGSGGGGTGGATVSGNGLKPNGQGGLLGTNVPTKFHSITGQDTDNQQAEVSKAVAQKQLESTSDSAIQAQKLLPVLDNLRDLYQKAIPDPVSVKNPLDIGGRAKLAAQGYSLDHLQGSGNPAWVNYKRALDAFSTAIGRGEFTEVGRIPALQGMTNIKAYPGSGDSKETANGFWDLNYNKIGSTFSLHNKTVKQYGADPTLKQFPNSKYIGKEPDRAKVMSMIASGNYKNNHGQLIKDWQDEYDDSFAGGAQ